MPAKEVDPGNEFRAEGAIMREGGKCVGVFPSRDGSHVLRVFCTRNGDIVAHFIDGELPTGRARSSAELDTLRDEYDAAGKSATVLRIYPETLEETLTKNPFINPSLEAES